MEPHKYQIGDVIRHTKCPEWGKGTVDSATTVLHNGERVQRLVVSFEHHKRTTLNTAFAAIEPAVENPELVGQGPQSWLEELEGKNPMDVLTSVPEAASDPFRSLGARLKTTLDLYRFTSEARSLIDWAVAQTGLGDPLSRFSRHELEEAFGWFEKNLDAHLFELVQTIKRKGERDVLADAKKHSCPRAQKALSFVVKGERVRRR